MTGNRRSPARFPSMARIRRLVFDSYPCIIALVRDGAIVVETPPPADRIAWPGHLAARTTIQFDGDVISKFDQETGVYAQPMHFEAVDEKLADLAAELRRAGVWLRCGGLAALIGRRTWQAGGASAALTGGLSAMGGAAAIPPYLIAAAANLLLPALLVTAVGAAFEAAGRFGAAKVRQRLGL